MAAFDEIKTRISIECEDNCDGFPGVVVYGNISYPIPSQHDTIERTASGNGQSPYSSVRPFQLAHHENEDSATLDIYPPENASLQDEEEEEEEEEEGE